MTKLLIEIPDELLEAIKDENKILNTVDTYVMRECIMHGTAVASVEAASIKETLSQVREEIELFLPDSDSHYEAGISDALTIIDTYLKEGVVKV